MSDRKQNPSIWISQNGQEFARRGTPEEETRWKCTGSIWTSKLKRPGSNHFPFYISLSSLASYFGQTFQKSTFHALASPLHFLVSPTPPWLSSAPQRLTKGTVTPHPRDPFYCCGCQPLVSLPAAGATWGALPFLKLSLSASMRLPTPSWPPRSASSWAPFSAPPNPPNLKCQYFLVTRPGFPILFFSVKGFSFILLVLSVLYQLLDL